MSEVSEVSDESSDEKVHHFSDRSMRRLLESPAYVRYLVELLLPELVGFLDFDKGEYQPRSLLSDSLHERELDVLLRVPFQASIEAEALHICILVEHQSRSDRLMRLRLLIYMVRIWESEYRRLGSRGEGEQAWSPILPIVFYTGSERWTAPLSLAEVLNVPRVLERFVPTFETLFLDVKRTEGEALTASGHPFGWLLRVLQEEIAEGPVFRETLETAASEIGRSRETQVSADRSEALNYLIHLIFHRRSPAERDRFVDIIKAHSPNAKEVETMAQTAAEALIEQGKAEGILEGIEQGIEQGARQMSIENTLLILSERFPEADVPAIKPRLDAISDINRLRQLNRNALTAGSFQTFQDDLYA